MLILPKNSERKRRAIQNLKLNRTALLQKRRFIHFCQDSKEEKLSPERSELPVKLKTACFPLPSGKRSKKQARLYALEPLGVNAFPPLLLSSGFRRTKPIRQKKFSDVPYSWGRGFPLSRQRDFPHLRNRLHCGWVPSGVQ